MLSSLSADAVSDMFARVLRAAGAGVVRTLAHEFPGAGLTSVLILTESHAVLHTWPETGTVHIDIFSCSHRLRSLAAVEELGALLGAADVSVREIPRANGHAPAAD